MCIRDRLLGLLVRMREQIIFCIAGMFSFFLRDQLSDTFDLLTEIPRGPEDTALTSDNELDVYKRQRLLCR